RKIWPCRRPPRRSGRRRARLRRCNEQRNKETTSMYAFKYQRPNTVRQAVNMLAKDPDAKLLSGGHSLLPVMKLRLAKPSQLLDISKIEGLSGIELKGRSLVIGATTKHVDVANSDIVKQALPVLASLAAGIGDPMVRH